MKYHSTIIALTLLLTSSLPAETTTQPATQPVKGKGGSASRPSDTTNATVTGTGLYVRSSPSSKEGAVCDKVDKPLRITVVGWDEKYWKILPTPGCRCFISRRFVRPDNKGKIGTVLGNRLCVRVGRGGKAGKVIARANRGDNVHVLAESGDYYVIAPPKGIRFYVSTTFIKGDPPARKPPSPVGLIPQGPMTPEQLVARVIKAMGNSDQNLFVSCFDLATRASLPVEKVFQHSRAIQNLRNRAVEVFGKEAGNKVPDGITTMLGIDLSWFSQAKIVRNGDKAKVVWKKTGPDRSSETKIGHLARQDGRWYFFAPDAPKSTGIRQMEMAAMLAGATRILDDARRRLSDKEMTPEKINKYINKKTWEAMKRGDFLVPQASSVKTVTKPGDKAEGATWSQTVNGLQARITLKRSAVSNGTPIISTYLELRNVSNSATPMRLAWAREKMKFRVIDADGRELPLAMGCGNWRSLGTQNLVIPNRGTLSFDISSRGLGIPGDQAGLIDLGSTYNWVFKHGGKDYYLRAVLEIPKNKNDKDDRNWWHGKIEIPPVKVPLKPEPVDPAKLGDLIRQLGGKMLATNSNVSEKAVRALSLIDDERVIPWYLKAMDTNRYGLKFAALDRLSRFNSDEALRGLKKGMTTRGADIGNCTTDAVAAQAAGGIRHSAACALSRSPHPEARKMLLSLWNDPSRAVRMTVLHELGRMDSAKSLNLLKKMSKDPDKDVRKEALRYLKLRETHPAAKPAVKAEFGMVFICAEPVEVLADRWDVVLAAEVQTTEKKRLWHKAGPERVGGRLAIREFLYKNPKDKSIDPQKAKFFKLTDGLRGLKAGDKVLVFAIRHDDAYGITPKSGSNCRIGIKVENWNDPIVKATRAACKGPVSLATVLKNPKHFEARRRFNKSIADRIAGNQATAKPVVREYARHIEAALPKGWYVEIEKDIVTVSRKKSVEMDYRNMPCRSAVPDPGPMTKTEEKAYLMARGDISSRTYSIRIRFAPPISKAGVARLKQENQKTRERYYRKHPVPTHKGPRKPTAPPAELTDALHFIPDILNDKCSMFLYLPIEGIGYALYEKADQAECRKVDQTVLKILKSNKAQNRPATKPASRPTTQSATTTSAPAVDSALMAMVLKRLKDEENFISDSDFEIRMPREDKGPKNKTATQPTTQPATKPAVDLLKMGPVLKDIGLVIREQAATLQKLTAKTKPDFTFGNGGRDMMWVGQDEKGNPQFTLDRAYVHKPKGKPAKWVLLTSRNAPLRLIRGGCEYLHGVAKLRKKVPTNRSCVKYALVKSTDPKGGTVYEIVWQSTMSGGTSLAESERHLFVLRDGKGRWRFIGEGPSGGHGKMGYCKAWSSAVDARVKWTKRADTPVRIHFVATSAEYEWASSDMLQADPTAGDAMRDELKTRLDWVLDGKLPTTLRKITGRPYILARPGDTFNKVVRHLSSWSSGWRGNLGKGDRRIEAVWKRELTRLNPKLPTGNIPKGTRINLLTHAETIGLFNRSEPAKKPADKAGRISLQAKEVEKEILAYVKGRKAGQGREKYGTWVKGRDAIMPSLIPHLLASSNRSVKHEALILTRDHYGQRKLVLEGPSRVDRHGNTYRLDSFRYTGLAGQKEALDIFVARIRTRSDRRLYQQLVKDLVSRLDASTGKDKADTWAVKFLGRLGARKTLREMLGKRKDPFDLIGREMLTTLSQVGDRRAVPLLIALAGREDQAGASLVNKALGRMMVASPLPLKQDGRTDAAAWQAWWDYRPGKGMLSRAEAAASQKIAMRKIEFMPKAFAAIIVPAETRILEMVEPSTQPGVPGKRTPYSWVVSYRLVRYVTLKDIWVGYSYSSGATLIDAHTGRWPNLSAGEQGHISAVMAATPANKAMLEKAQAIRVRFPNAGVKMWEKLADLLKPGMTVQDVQLIMAPLQFYSYSSQGSGGGSMGYPEKGVSVGVTYAWTAVDRRLFSAAGPISSKPSVRLEQSAPATKPAVAPTSRPATSYEEAFDRSLRYGPITRKNLQRLQKALKAPGTRLLALQELLDFAGLFAYQGGGVSIMTGDAVKDALRSEAAKTAHSAADAETVSKALDDPDAILRDWGIWHFGDKASLLPKLQRIAQKDDVALRSRAVSCLRRFARMRGFLRERAKVEKSPYVLDELIFFRTNPPSHAHFNRRLRELLADKDKKVRIDVLQYIAGNTWSAPARQFNLEAELVDSVVKRILSGFADERKVAISTFQDVVGDESIKQPDACVKWWKENRQAWQAGRIPRWGRSTGSLRAAIVVSGVHGGNPPCRVKIFLQNVGNKDIHIDLTKLAKTYFSILDASGKSIHAHYQGGQSALKPEWVVLGPGQSAQKTLNLNRWILHPGRYTLRGVVPWQGGLALPAIVLEVPKKSITTQPATHPATQPIVKQTCVCGV